jgi:DNA invertase Pin-like site-specific DNA recombinase
VDLNDRLMRLDPLTRRIDRSAGSPWTLELQDRRRSGAKFERPGLAALLDYARPGDTVVVASLDRLGRSLSQMIATADDLHRRGIVLKSIKESID